MKAHHDCISHLYSLITNMMVFIFKYNLFFSRDKTYGSALPLDIISSYALNYINYQIQPGHVLSFAKNHYSI